MKKLFALLIAVVLVCSLVVSAGAATGITAEEKAIITALSQKIEMKSGTIVSLPDKYINQAEDYLSKAELTTQQINDILKYIDNAADVVADSSAKSLSLAEVAVKEAVVKEAKDAAKVVGATLSVESIPVTGEAGEVVANYEAVLVFGPESTVPGYTEGTRIELSSKNTEIEKTGVEGSVTATVVGSVVVLVAAAFVVVASRKKALSK
jgi:hypothetical protein